MSDSASLTVGAGEVSPVEHGAVEGRQGHVEEQIGAVGRTADGVGEQVHLEQGLNQIPQHLALPLCLLHREGPAVSFPPFPSPSLPLSAYLECVFTAQSMTLLSASFLGGGVK